MHARFTFLCSFILIILISNGLSKSVKPEKSVKKEIQRTLRDLKDLDHFVELMKKKIPEKIEGLVRADSSVIRLEELLNQPGNEQCNKLFHERLQHFSKDVSNKTLESIKEETTEYSNMLWNLRKQLSSGPAATLEGKSDDASVGWYHDILQIVDEDLKYEEDSIKVMGSSFVEDAKEKLLKELEQTGIFFELGACFTS